jgi:hypothetical protein
MSTKNPFLRIKSVLLYTDWLVSAFDLFPESDVN